MKSTVRYIYFGHTKTTKHRGITCIGYFYNSVLKTINYQVAQCSPKDRFCKKTARDIIADRFKNSVNFIIENVEVTHGNYTEPKYITVINLIRDHFNSQKNKKNISNYTSKYFPQWFKSLPKI